MNKLSSYLIIVLLIAFVVTPLRADNKVVVEGVASSRDAALDRALRDAVRQGAGVDINSLSTLVANEDDEEFREQTVSATMGAVTSYRILEAVQQNGAWRVKIEAMVSRKQVGKPEDVNVQDAKVIVIARQRILKFPTTIGTDASYFQTEIEQELVDRHFDVRFALFDKKKVFNPTNDLPNMGIDPLQADIIIFAEVDTKYRGKKVFYNLPRHRVQTTVTLKAIRPDSLKIVASEMFKADVKGRDLEKAAEGAIERAVDKISTKFVDNLVKKLIWERNNGRIFSLHLQGKGLPSDNMLRFASLVSNLPGMLKVIPRHRTKKKTLIDCLTYLGRNAMMQTIYPVLNELNLEVSGFQSNSFVLGPYSGKKARVWVDSIPQGAEVYLDMAMLGDTPILTEIDPGSHNLRFSCLGFHDTKTTIQAVRGRVVRVMAELETQELAIAKGRVTLTSTPSGATVKNEKDQVIGKTPMENYELNVGTHHLKLVLNEYQTKVQKVVVEKDQTVKYEVGLVKAVDLAKTFRERYLSGTSKRLLQRARSERNGSRFKQAINILQKAVEQDEKCVEAYREMGEIYEFDLYELSSALSNYTRFYRHFGDQVPAKERKKAAYKTEIKLIEEAIDRVEKKIKEDREAANQEP